jgi:hypothetical protein
MRHAAVARRKIAVLLLAVMSEAKVAYGTAKKSELARAEELS